VRRRVRRLPTCRGVLVPRHGAVAGSLGRAEGGPGRPTLLLAAVRAVEDHPHAKVVSKVLEAVDHAGGSTTGLAAPGGAGIRHAPDAEGHVMTDLPPGGKLEEDELTLLDGVAATTIEGETAGYETDPRLRPGAEIHSHSAAGFYTTTVP